MLRSVALRARGVPLLLSVAFHGLLSFSHSKQFEESSGYKLYGTKHLRIRLGWCHRLARGDCNDDWQFVWWLHGSELRA